MDPNARPHYTFFRHEKCEFFPCHSVKNPRDFNCLFCYCPLYGLGRKCGGDFVYLESGIKDCSNCTIPHDAGGYDYITSRFALLAKLAAE